MHATRTFVPAAALRIAFSLTAASTADAQVAIPTFDVREEIRIQSNDTVPGMLLTGVEDLTVLPDGRIVTSHPRESVVRVFDPSGKLIRILGGPGDGPGEFRSVRQVGYAGDRIWAEEIGRGYHVFDVRTYEPKGRISRGPTSGNFAGLTSDSTSFHYTGAEDSTRLSIYDRAGERRMAIALTIRQAGHHFEVPWSEISPGGFLTGRTVPVTRYSPLRVLTRIALAPGGQEIMVLEASELWKGPSGQFTIRRISTATGRISTPVTVVLPVRRVTASEADSLIKRSAPRVRAPRDEKTAEAYKAKAKVPLVYPAFEYFTPSPDGVLWVAEYAKPDSRLVVDLAGKPLMRVRLPSGFRVIAVSRTHVWGVTQDADDLPIISRYRVTTTG